MGIHVSLVEPGPFRTNLTETLRATESAIKDYDAVRKSVRKTLERALTEGGDPERAAEVIVKIAHSRAPRFRYGVGSGAAWLPYLRALLPRQLFDYLVRRGFGLTKTDNK